MHSATTRVIGAKMIGTKTAVVERIAIENMAHRVSPVVWSPRRAFVAL
jgi:hypothetical protein